MIKACVFDAYGTLFDVHSAVARHGAAPAVSELWRIKQLEYSWVRTLARRHADFWQCTQDALDYALATHAITQPGLRDGLLQSYRTLDVYPDVRPALGTLRDLGQKTAVLSNGTPNMLAEAVAAGGLGDMLDHVLSVEAVGCFKPTPAAYALATRALGVSAHEILFLSSNAWDAMGAQAFGMTVCWVNRTARPPEYGTMPAIRSLAEINISERQAPATTPGS